MKRVLLFLLILVSSINMYPQTQQGIVKTRGRLSSTGQLIPGIRLQGATISVKNGGSHVSGNNGAFAFAVPSQSYYLTNVQKKDYQLCDRDVLGKSLKYSSNPLVVVMDTPDQILEDRLESEGKIRTTLTTQLNQKKAELKQLKEQQKISQQEYNKLLQELYALQNNNEKLISEMAERYSTLDFEEMDEFQRTISYLIQNGELIKADSLLKTKDIKKLGEELDQMDEIILADAEEIAKRQAAHEQAVKFKSQKLEEFASLCYNNYEVCKLQHKIDSAAYWLELGASKDTLNVSWQLEVGEFLQHFVANHNLALQYYERALHNSLLLYDLNNEFVATCYNNIATILQYKDDFSGALDYHLKALGIRLTLFSEKHASVALSFYNIGIVYKEKGDYIKAIENYKKALDIWEKVEDYRYKCAFAYNEIGTILHKQGNDNEAVKFHQRAIEILSSMDKLTDEQQIELAVSYDEIGCVYRELGNKEKGLESHNKALSFFLKIFDECTPHVATVYNNIGNTFDSLGDSQKAIEFLQKALDIWLVLLGEEHSYVGICYSNMAWPYRTLGNNRNALECHQKALEIFQRCYEENHPNFANVYNNIGFDYHLLGDFPNALYYNQKALAIYRKIYGENHQYILNLYEVIGNLFIEASNKNIILDGSQEYFSNLIYLGSTNDADSSSPAKKKGMNGDYILLSVENWNIDSSVFLTNVLDELRGNPKTVVVMKDGVISRFNFEDSLGLNITLKYLSKEEKQRIVNAYNKWQKKNKKKKK